MVENKDFFIMNIMIMIVNGLITLIGLGILAVNIKLYTEFFKDKSRDAAIKMEINALSDR